MHWLPPHWPRSLRAVARRRRGAVHAALRGRRGARAGDRARRAAADGDRRVPDVRSGGVGVLVRDRGRARARGQRGARRRPPRAAGARSAPPSGWRYGGSVFTRVMKARVSILEVRGYDAGGHRITPPPLRARRPVPDGAAAGAEALRPAAGGSGHRHGRGRAGARARRAPLAARPASTTTTSASCTRCFCAAAGEPVARLARPRRAAASAGREWSVPELFARRSAATSRTARPRSRSTYGRLRRPVAGSPTTAPATSPTTSSGSARAASAAGRSRPASGTPRLSAIARCSP